LESAETPGDASVTSELSVEDWLSSGILSKSCRSTSVCVVGSVSTKSAAASTVTAVLVAPSASMNFSSTGSGERTVDILCRGLEVRRACCQVIVVERDVVELERSPRVAHDFLIVVGNGIKNLDCAIRDGRAGGIQYGAAHRAGRRLGVADGTSEEKEDSESEESHTPTSVADGLANT
jgi:hypothetical protein